MGFSQQVSLTENAEISIITVDSGNNLVDAWGHSAIRVRDASQGFDLAFNYGTYDFNTPNFYGKFAQGKLLYVLSLGHFHNFLRNYIRENRTVKEQVLNLTYEEKQQYFSFLRNNAKPENRAYLYDFLFDNCATKLRDVSDEIFTNKIEFSYDFANGKEDTFRELIHDYLDNHAWGAFGIDLALGSVIDRKVKPLEYAFLPDYIFESFKSASITSNGQRKDLIKSTTVLYTSEPKKVSFSLSPSLIFSLIALVVIFFTYRDYKSKKRSRWLDVTLFSVTGLIGVFVLLLWFATDHSATAKNFNFLWAFAPNLVVAFLIVKKGLPS